MPDGSDAVDGLVEEMTPPKDGQPGRFVQTWHVLYDASLSAEPPGRVEWTVEGVGEGLTRVRLVHGDLAYSPLTWAHVKDGWVWILDGLKTLLETGRPLPSPEVLAPESATPEGDWHRRQGVEANNAVHGLLERDRTPENDEDLLRHAYAAAYHWQRATGARPENEARASYMVARALSRRDRRSAGWSAPTAYWPSAPSTASPTSTSRTGTRRGPVPCQRWVVRTRRPRRRRWRGRCRSPIPRTSQSWKTTSTDLPIA